LTIYTDHQPLKYLLTLEEPAPKLARWLDQLRMFDLKIEYRKGNANCNADAHSHDRIWHAQIEEGLEPTNKKTLT
jgi:hypothetical protein